MVSCVSPASGPASGAGSGLAGATGCTIAAAELLAWRRRLLAAGDGGPELDWLLEFAGGLSREARRQLQLQPQQPVQLRASLAVLEQLWWRHRHGAEPLQYLVGCCPWRDLDLAVAPGVLIPRQETELLVDLALQRLPSVPEPALHWADLGTGSGCLAVALARALPAARGFAVDLSPVALAQAAANLERWGAPAGNRLSLLCSDWWTALEPWWGQLHLVVSNPPYIPTPLLSGLDPVVRDHEPTLALDGGPDGLAAIRAILALAPRALAPGGVLLLEHHHDHSQAVLALLAAAGLEQGCAHQDLEGVWRFASAVRRLG
jgi:release factor glutamine methyltransferase